MNSNNTPLIIGISGQIGVGKDYIINNYLTKTINLPYIVLAFSDHFKLDVIVKDKVPRELVYGNKNKFSRKLLQKRGLDEGRDIYGPDVWIEYVKNQILNHTERGIKIFFISDVRFKNEVEFIKNISSCFGNDRMDNNGHTIRIVAPERNKIKIYSELERSYKEENNRSPTPEELKKGFEEISSHRSETDLSEYPFEYVINNDIDSSNTVCNLCVDILDDIWYNKDRKYLVCYSREYRDLGDVYNIESQRQDVLPDLTRLTLELHSTCSHYTEEDISDDISSTLQEIKDYIHEYNYTNNNLNMIKAIDSGSILIDILEYIKKERESIRLPKVEEIVITLNNEAFLYSPSPLRQAKKYLKIQCECRRVNNPVYIWE